MEKEIASTLEENLFFPSKHYMPKEITQQSKFLEKHPEYDGRNTIIAILDTGVDPSLPGLQTTTTGLPKIIDCLDLTGAGDVDTSTIKKADENGILIGITERELKIPKEWKNPSGDWHLGIKAIHELYSYYVEKRINEDKLDTLQKRNKSAIGEVMKELGEHEKKIGEKTKKISDKEDRDDINSKLEYLKAVEKELKIESPLADCIVWFDGEKWKAVIDTSLIGDLENAKVMGSFFKDREFGFISDKCLVSYCFTIHDSGNLLEICAPSNSHGSHVAHIAAGHFPDDPEKDGLAPGAQIVSMCVGDSRRNSGLTAQAFIRAINKCIELKVDAINFSFGAYNNFTKFGNVGKIISKAIDQYGILFFKSSGNSGPALSTLPILGHGHPSMIQVGAYLTAEMKESIYAHYEADSSVVYPFSSRGPSADGSLGICISAPGAAITGVPKYTLSNSELYNGTSMSSPNACGNVACLLSGMKAEGIPISPFRVKLAIMNSAMLPEDGSHHPFSLGAGILQIDSAFELIKNSMNSIPSSLTDILINVGGKQRGIYLREAFENNCPKSFTIYNLPQFKKSEELEHQLSFERQINLKLAPSSEETTDFVKFPKFCRIPSNCFGIEVDPTKLEKGKVHYAEIWGLDSSMPSMGPLFRIPITVIIPSEITSSPKEHIFKTHLTLEPAVPHRIFLQPPPKATHAAVFIKSVEDHKVSGIHLQATYQDAEKSLICNVQRYAEIHPNQRSSFDIDDLQNSTIEFCFTSAWQNLGETKLKVKIQFYGFDVPNCASLFSSNPTNLLSFTNNLGYTYVNPTIQFSYFSEPLVPEESVIEAMKERDIIDEQKSFRLLMTYKFKVSTEQYFTFGFSGLYDYYKYIDCFMIQISTESKKHVSTICRNVKLVKGDYIIHVQFRHSDPQILEKIKCLPLMASHELTKKITPYLYLTSKGALTNEGTKICAKYYNEGEQQLMYMEPISWIYLPSAYPAGSYLEGTLSLNYYADVTIKYYLVTARKIDLKTKALTLEPMKKVPKDISNPFKKDLNKAIRTTAISYITKHSNAKEGEAIFQKLSTEHPTHIPIFAAEIERLSKAKNLEGMKKVVKQLLEIAEIEKLAQFFGTKSEFDEEKLRQKAKMEKKKTAISNALFAMANLTLDEFLRNSEDPEIAKFFQDGFDPKKKIIASGVKVDAKKEDAKVDEKKGENETIKIDDVSTTKENPETKSPESSSESQNSESQSQTSEKKSTQTSILQFFQRNSKIEIPNAIDPPSTAPELAVVFEEVKKEADSKVGDATEASKSVPTSPGNISQNSNLSEDSYEKISINGESKEEKNEEKESAAEVKEIENMESESNNVATSGDNSPTPEIETPSNSSEENNEISTATEASEKAESPEKTLKPSETSPKSTVTENSELKKSIIEEMPKPDEAKKVEDEIQPESISAEKLLEQENEAAKKAEEEAQSTNAIKIDLPKKVTKEEVEKVFREYMNFADEKSENAKIICVKYAIANARFGTALSELKKIITDKTTSPDYQFTEIAIIHILKKLGWHHLAEEAQKACLIKHQKTYRLL